MTLLIMAAGLGSRYGGLKQLDPINGNGEFIIDYSIYDALLAGFDNVVFIIKEENLEVFKETIGDRIAKKVKVGYAFQNINNIPDGYSFPDRTKPWGTAHAVLCAKDLINENFAVINADDFYGRDAFVKLAETLKTLKTTDKYNFCMAGYILKNTITENGHVARGICTVENDQLVNVVERTQIQRNNGVVQFFEDDVWTNTPEDGLVSMNCWGFTPDIFKEIERGLVEFLEKNKNDMGKKEYFLPSIVQELIDEKKCTVKVLKTSAKWYGVTYKEDKQIIEDFISTITANKTYPNGLWQ
ncbi:MAG: sugar phosphate nucleotidyltransferase [Clostridia bacterium]